MLTMADGEDEFEETCFLNFPSSNDDETDADDARISNVVTTDCKSKETPTECTEYNSRKPKWWVQRSRKATKSQRRAMAAMESYKLPRVSYGQTLDFNSVFPFQKIWLELGFGQGENLLANAQLHPNVGLVGADIHKPGVGTVMKRMHESIQTGNYWQGFNVYTPSKDPFSSQNSPQDKNLDKKERNHTATEVDPATKPYSNVRVHMGDGVKLLPYIPTGSLTALFVTFPDPFPNKADEQYRLINVNTMKEIHRVLTHSGRFFLATDHEGYFEWCYTVLKKINGYAVSGIEDGEEHVTRFRLVEPCPDRNTWLPVISKYEQKGWDEGRRTLLQCWEVS